MDDALDQCKADAGAFEFLNTVQTLKHLKQLVCVVHVEAGAVVPDRVNDLRPFDHPGDVDDRFRPQRRKLDRVAEEVAKDLADQSSIAMDGGQRPNVQ